MLGLLWGELVTARQSTCVILLRIALLLIDLLSIREAWGLWHRCCPHTQRVMRELSSAPFWTGTEFMSFLRECLRGRGKAHLFAKGFLLAHNVDACAVMYIWENWTQREGKAVRFIDLVALITAICWLLWIMWREFFLEGAEGKWIK